VQDFDDLYQSLVSSEWQNTADVVLSSREPQTLLDERSSKPGLAFHEHRMMYWDAMTYLPDDI